MSSIWNTSLDMLARRDYSRAELKVKLEARFPKQETEIDDVLQRLAAQHLQSDERYAEVWIHSQLSKGRGPERIVAEARQKGIEVMVAEQLSLANIDWFEKALAVGRRKFNLRLQEADQAKVYRFLSYRGFPQETIRLVIESLMQENSEH